MERTEERAARLAKLRGLYAVTPDATDTAALLAKCAAALDGGAVVIQVRNKSASPALRREQARAIAELCRARGALSIVNDDPALAREVGADGVHLGEDDAAIADARAVVGPGRLVGASCYDALERAPAALAAGADHVAFGSFYASGTKPGARRAPLDLLGRARALGAPVVAIGGIDENNAGALAEAGADAVAVIGALFAHDDPDDVADAARRIAAAFAARRPPARISDAASLNSRR